MDDQLDEQPEQQLGSDDQLDQHMRNLLDKHLRALIMMERTWQTIARHERQISYVLMLAFVVFCALVGIGVWVRPEALTSVHWWAIGFALFGCATWWREANKSEWYAMKVRMDALRAQVEFAATMHKRG